MFEPGKPIISLTEAAAEQARRLIAAADGDIAGLRIGIKTAGCSGLQYDVQYADEAKPFEDKIEDKGVTVFIDPSAVMFLVGSEMDWEEDKFCLLYTSPSPRDA